MDFWLSIHFGLISLFREVTMSDASLAAIFTAVGIFSTKALDFLTNRTKAQHDYDTVTREELRKEITSIREELKIERKEREKWQDRYFQEYKQHLDLQNRYNALEKDYNELKTYLQQQGITVPGLLTQKMSPIPVTIVDEDVKA